MCNLNKNGECTDYMAECGMTGTNTCCLACERRWKCEDTCEYAREVSSDG